eukprot:468329-Heterocapsa_arctica.AAC.1
MTTCSDDYMQSDCGALAHCRIGQDMSYAHPAHVMLRPASSKYTLPGQRLVGALLLSSIHNTAR